MGIAQHRLIVDVQQPGAQSLPDGQGASDGARHDRGSQAVVGLVGQRHRLVIGGEGRHGCHGAEHLLVEGAHAGAHPAQRRRLEEQAVVGAAGVQHGACLDTVPDRAQSVAAMLPARTIGVQPSTSSRRRLANSSPVLPTTGMPFVFR